MLQWRRVRPAGSAGLGMHRACSAHSWGCPTGWPPCSTPHLYPHHSKNFLPVPRSVHCGWLLLLKDLRLNEFVAQHDRCCLRSCRVGAHSMTAVGEQERAGQQRHAKYSCQKTHEKGHQGPPTVPCWGPPPSLDHGRRPGPQLRNLGANWGYGH